MKQSNEFKDNHNNKQKNKFLKYEEFNKLNDQDFVYISTSFLYYILGYYELINKATKEINDIIANTFKSNKSDKRYIDDPRYSKILVKDARILLKKIPETSIRKSAFLKIKPMNDKITSNEAYQLLIKDTIKDKNDFFKEENKWILHSLYVGSAARRIATKLELDGDYAASLGYIHDIGRKFSHDNHLIEGYKYLTDKGFHNEARICLTHSFIDNDINLTAGGGPKSKETYDFINSFLEKSPKNIYDNIIQLCDLFCLETGFTTIEKRILDITKRKGIYDNSYNHFMKTIELKERIEEMMECNLYDLFPEIKKEDLDNIESDYLELINLLKPKKLSL